MAYHLAAAGFLPPFKAVQARKPIFASHWMQERPDVAYHLVAVDFLPPPIIQAALTRLASEFASGAQHTSDLKGAQNVRYRSRQLQGQAWRLASWSLCIQTQQCQKTSRTGRKTAMMQCTAWRTIGVPSPCTLRRRHIAAAAAGARARQLGRGAAAAGGGESGRQDRCGGGASGRRSCSGCRTWAVGGHRRPRRARHPQRQVCDVPI